MRRLNCPTRQDLRSLKLAMRWSRLQRKWIASNPQRRAETGDAVLAELALLLDSLDGDPIPYITDPECRLNLQHWIGMLQSRVALDLGRPEEAMRFAAEFNRRCQELLDLAVQEGLIADKPKLFEEYSKMNKDLYDEVTAAWQQRTG